MYSATWWKKSVSYSSIIKSIERKNFWRKYVGIEPTRDIQIPHTGFEDQETHQHLSTPKLFFLINHRHYSKTLYTLQAKKCINQSTDYSLSFFHAIVSQITEGCNRNLSFMHFEDDVLLFWGIPGRRFVMMPERVRSVQEMVWGSPCINSRNTRLNSSGRT